MQEEWGARKHGTKELLQFYLNALLSVGGEQLVEKKNTLDEWAENGVKFQLTKDGLDEDDSEQGDEMDDGYRATDAGSDWEEAALGEDDKVAQHAASQLRKGS